jgi:O-antigen/teichoic acid export membrane protein
VTSFRALGKDFVAYGIMGALSRSVHIVLLPILTRFLSTEEYGVVDIVAAMVSVLGLMMALTLESAVARSWFEASEDDQRKELVSSVMLFVLLWGALLVGVTWSQAGRIASYLLGDSTAGSLVILGSLAALLGALVQIPQTSLRMERRIAHYTAISLIQTVSFAGLAAFFVARHDTGVEGVFLAQVLANGAALLAGAYSTRRYVGFRMSLESLKASLSFSVPLFPAVAVTHVNRYADRVILVLFLGLASVGVFAAAARIALIMGLLVDITRQAWLPFSMSALEEKATRGEFFRRALNYYAGALLLAGLIISAYCRELMAVFVPDEYLAGYAVIPWLMLGQILSGSAQFTNLGILITRKTSRISIAAWAGASVNIGIGLILIPRIGIWGAAIGSAVAGLILTALSYWFSQRVCELKFDSRKVLAMLGCYVVGCATIVGAYELVVDPFPSIIVRSVALLLAACIILWLTIDAPILRMLRSAMGVQAVE